LSHPTDGTNSVVWRRASLPSVLLVEELMA
jgi:hypothetical protein